MKDPVVDSGLPQEDHPGSTGKRFPSFLLWTLPLLASGGLLQWGLERRDFDALSLDFLEHGIWLILGLAVGSVGLYALWSWRTRSVACPRCKRRLARAGRDITYAYFPCTGCGVMWRVAAARLPTMMMFDDL
jgi:hypothetical protein